jgi:hypothetical protein
MKAKKEMKLKTEPKVHYDFPYPEFKTKEAWLKEVRKNWTAFYKAFEETKVSFGCHYYPFKVLCWIAAFNSDEINMNRLMDEYCNDTSNEPTGEMITPLSMGKNEVKILKDEIIRLKKEHSESAKSWEIIIHGYETSVNCYKKMLDIPVKPERTLRIV